MLQDKQFRRDFALSINNNNISEPKRSAVNLLSVDDIIIFFRNVFILSGGQVSSIFHCWDIC